MQDNNAHSWCMLSTYKGITCHMSQYTIQSQVWSVHCPTGAQNSGWWRSMMFENFVIVLTTVYITDKPKDYLI